MNWQLKRKGVKGTMSLEYVLTRTMGRIESRRGGWRVYVYENDDDDPEDHVFIGEWPTKKKADEMLVEWIAGRVRGY